MKQDENSITLDFGNIRPDGTNNWKNIIRLYCVMKALKEQDMIIDVLVDRYNGGFLYTQYLPLECDPYDFHLYQYCSKKTFTLEFSFKSNIEKEFFDNCISNKNNDEVIASIINLFSRYFESIDKVGVLADVITTFERIHNTIYDPRCNAPCTYNIKTLTLLLNHDFGYDNYLMRKIVKNNNGYKTALSDKGEKIAILVFYFDIENEDEKSRYEYLLEEGSYIAIKARLILEFEEIDRKNNIPLTNYMVNWKE